MKTSVVLVALVVVVGLAECSPNLQAKLEQLKQRVADKRALDKDIGNGKMPGQGGKQQLPSVDPAWPYAWIELVSFVGKCISAKNFFELIGYTPEEGILAMACPKVMEEMENCEMDTLTDAQILEATIELRKHFKLFQCVNLQADRESVLFWSSINESEDAEEFEKEAAPLFAECLDTFISSAKMDKEFEEDVQKATDDNSRRVTNALRQLINYAKKR